MALEFWWPSLWGTNNNMILTSYIITRAHGSRECMPQFIRNKYQDNNTTHINIMVSPMRILYHNSCPWLSSIHTQVYEKPISTQWYLSHAPYTITRAHGSRESLPKFIKNYQYNRTFHRHHIPPLVPTGSRVCKLSGQTYNCWFILYFEPFA